jgi:hypothetical protein
MPNPIMNRRVVLAATFAPTDISGLKLWLKADSLALSDGDPVTTWPDSSGQGNNAAQATGSKKPTYKASIQNGRPAVRFDGVDDALKVSSITLPTFFTIFVAGRFTNAAPMFVEQSADANANDGFYFYGNNGNIAVIRRTSAHSANGAANWMGSTAAIVGLTYDGTHAVRRNGADVTITGTAGTTRPNSNVTADLFLGSRNEASIFSSGDFFEILIYGSPLSSADRLRVETYLNGRWAIY